MKEQLGHIIISYALQKSERSGLNFNIYFFLRKKKPWKQKY